MDRQEAKSKIIGYFRQQIKLQEERPDYRPQIQMGFLDALFRDEMQKVPAWQHDAVLSVAREIIQEMINCGTLYPGQRGQVFGSDFYPWLTITEYGKQVFTSEDWLPYDPDGYLAELKRMAPEIDDVTLAYIGESVASFNRHHLLSATITLGVASENLMLALIEAYRDWIKDAERKGRSEKHIADKWISTQYAEFRKEFVSDIKSLPKELQADWETYLDGIFNFVRLNRNSAGHPTGKAMSAKVVYADLQIFADYARYIFNLIGHLKNH
jgi:hypothetical protein